MDETLKPAEEDAAEDPESVKPESIMLNSATEIAGAAMSEEDQELDDDLDDDLDEDGWEEDSDEDGF